MIKLRAAVAATVVAGGVVAALATSAAPALAYFSGGLLLLATPQSPATLLAKGAAVNVPVQVICGGTPTADVNLRVTERTVGNRVATGFGHTTVQCDGQPHITTVTVTADPSGGVFRKGDAVATAFIFGCNNAFCGQDETTATIKIG